MAAAIIAYTIRVSMVLFLVVLVGWLLRIRPKQPETVFRVIWSLAFLLFTAHVVVAFHFRHHWSHASAWEETARQTRDLMGFEFGAGLYFNYLFMVLWAIDVLWVWFADSAVTKRFCGLRYACLGYLIFIAFNGVAVFKDGWMRATGIAALVLLAAVAAWRWSKRAPIEPEQLRLERDA